MDLELYLKKYQPFVYNTFVNSFKNNRISQAYLLKGEQGAPLLDIAIFLAKSLICEEPTPFSCQNCLSCIRFDEGNYSDFTLIDGNKQAIKVSDIENLQKFLSSSSLEKKGKKIYVINCLENANKESINALLKTLEEPSKNVYAFITTQNESKLLPTIISRCQVISLLPIDKNLVKEEAQSKGVSPEDSDILACLTSNIDSLVTLSKDENYLLVKECLMETLNNLDKSIEETIFYVETVLVKKIKTKENARLYFDLISMAFKDLLQTSFNQPIILENSKGLLKSIASKYHNLEKCYLEILLSRGRIEDNVNLNLLLQHIFIYIRKNGE